MKEKVTKIVIKLSVTTAMVFMFALNWGNMKEVKAAVAELYWPVRNSAGNAVTGLSSGHSDGDGHKGIDIANSAGCGWYAAYGGTVYKVYKGCVSNGYNTGGHNGCSPNHGRYYLSGTIGGVNYAGNYCNNGFGNGVVIECNINGTLYYMQYAHMDTAASNLYEGQSISQGTYLGTVGDRGFSFGTHAHFEINQGSQWGTAINNQPGAVGCQFTYNYGGISKPKNPQITKSSVWYDLADTIEVTAYADYATNYYISVFKDDRNIISQGVDGGKFTLNANIYGEGKYSCYFSCYNALGSVDTEWLEFAVVGKPSYSDISVLNEIYYPTQTVTFSVGTVCAKGMVIGIDKISDDGNTRILTEDCNSTSLYKLPASILGIGNYSAYFSVYNGAGSVDTKRVYFKIIDPNHIHEYLEEVTKEPSCEEVGEMTYTCTICKEVKTKNINVTGHTEVTDEAIAPTCTEKGMTEGSHCLVCGEVLVAQEEIPITSHTEVIDKTVVPTCTEKGKSEGKHCSVCGEVLVAQEELPAIGHTEVTDEASAPICTEKGKTEGKHCSVCETVIVAQKEIAPTQHVWNGGKVIKKASATAEGEKLYTCKSCGATKKEKISKLPANDNNETKELNNSDDENKADSKDNVTVGYVVNNRDDGTEYKVIETDEGSPTVEFTKYEGTESNIVIPDVIKINGISYKVTSVADDAFKNNKTITNIIIGDNVKTIGKNAFSGCVKLKSVIIGKNVTTIGSKAFYNCKSLTKITIPSKATKIGDYAFKNCKKLSSVTIGKAVKTIGKEAFRGCSKLKSINIKSKKLKTVGKNAFKGIKLSAKIKVLSSKLKSYKKLLKNKGQGKKVKITK